MLTKTCNFAPSMKKRSFRSPITYSTACRVTMNFCRVTLSMTLSLTKSNSLHRRGPKSQLSLTSSLICKPKRGTGPRRSSTLITLLTLLVAMLSTHPSSTNLPILCSTIPWTPMPHFLCFTSWKRYTMLTSTIGSST